MPAGRNQKRTFFIFLRIPKPETDSVSVKPHTIRGSINIFQKLLMIGLLVEKHFVFQTSDACVLSWGPVDTKTCYFVSRLRREKPNVQARRHGSVGGENSVKLVFNFRVKNVKEQTYGRAYRRRNDSLEPFSFMPVNYRRAVNTQYINNRNF